VASAAWWGLYGHIVIAVDDDTAWKQTARKLSGFGKTFEEIERMRLVAAKQTYFVFAKLELPCAQ